MKRNCLNCNDTLVGRLDKKFCCDQCRSIYNNKIKRQHEKYIIDINRILRKNRSILKQFNPEGKTTIRKQYLTNLGFDFGYHTHDFVTKNNNRYLFCYEYGYMFLEGEKILIVNKQDYMNSSNS